MRFKPFYSFALIVVFHSLLPTLHAQDSDKTFVYFDYNQKTLNKEESGKLVATISKINQEDLSEIVIQGFCDDRGNEDYNLKLSKQRADYVKGLLLAENLNPEIKLNTSGKGEIELDRSEGKLEELRAKNRYVEVEFKYINSTSISEKSDNPVTSLSDELKIGDYVLLEGILFEGGRHQPLAESFPHLKNLVESLEEYSDYSFMIQGHICCQTNGLDGIDQGTGERNLSEARAAAIYRYLIRNGISKDRLQYEGLKADYPTGKGDKYNRRVELLVTGKR